MEWVQVIERTADFVRLRYYPNQNGARGEYGEVTYFFATDKWTFDKIALGTRYTMHACNFVRQRYRNGEEIPQEGLAAWI